MSEDFDLDGYFKRIGYGGGVRPDLETLAAIQAHHVAAIPFEALDPLLGRPVPLDLAALQAKLVRSRRGGYCFEQNTLLRAALRAIGFQTTSLGARVLRGHAPGAPLPPRGHMVLLVDLPDGPRIVDVGLGIFLQDAPLRIDSFAEQTTPSGSYRLEADAGAFTLNIRQGGDWQSAFQFTLEPQHDADYEVANWFFATHPRSPFTQMVIMQRLTDAARIMLINTQLVERRRDGSVVERTLADAAELDDVLDKTFGIDPPAPAAKVFAKIAAT
ncbi:MAG TPA: arylamine N-acetyltransferase [Caulobacteraceae bacterium]|nr:arylamine N-acetyltransferase [Caulobacteraceae bacterium]